MRRVVAVLVAAPWVAWAPARVLGLDAVGHPVVAAMSFTTYAALTSPVPVVVAVVLRRWLTAAVALAAAVVLVVAVIPRIVPGPTAGSELGSGSTLTVMTLNTLGGAADARETLRLVERHRVDVLSLQELTPDGLRRLDAAGAARLLDQRSVDARPGAAGSGVLSRLPGSAADVEDSPSDAAQPELVVEVLGGGRVRVKAVHPYPPITSAKVRDWRRMLRAMPGPASGDERRILAGDFNATLDHRELRRLLDRGYTDAADAAGAGLTPTWPSHNRRPPITIDHVLFPPPVRVRRVTVHTVPGSDHRAVIATLVFP